MTEAYPLQWPQGWPRTKRPERARFGDHSLAYARDMLFMELERLGAEKVILSTNVPLRLDGLPRSSFKKLEDEGVAVYFELNGANQCFPCDRWDRVEHNMWAIMKSIEALRGLERWGAKDMVNAAFRGFQALPNYSNEAIIIGEPITQHFQHCRSLEDVEITWKSKRKYMHPDVGGSNEDFSELTKQYKEAKKQYQ